MDSSNAKLAEALVPAAYIVQGTAALGRRARELRKLLANRRLPAKGWDERLIGQILEELADMDTNNAPGGIGVGEREGRVVCPLVARRHFGLAHGVGRSGDVAAVQPKAAGSSLMYQLTNRLALHAARLAGLQLAKAGLVLPLATGMSLALCLRHLADARGEGAKYVLWSRIDQKACWKSITAAGLTCVVVDTAEQGDALATDMAGMHAAVERVGAERIAAVLTTTSCFAPRIPDDVVAVGKMCAALGIPHLVNNAYGLQASKITHQLNQAMRTGRVDAIVQSTDKNFMVPVGGALVLSSDPALVAGVSAAYAGRASAAPITDLFATLLYLGEQGWKEALAARKAAAKAAPALLSDMAAVHGERLLSTPQNPISFAVTLGALTSGGDPTEFGSMLYSRGVTGCRVVSTGTDKSVGGINLHHWGASAPAEYAHCPYLTVAIAIGQEPDAVTAFVEKFHKVAAAFKKRFPPASSGSLPSATLAGAGTAAASQDVSAESVPPP